SPLCPPTEFRTFRPQSISRPIGVTGSSNLEERTMIYWPRLLVTVIVAISCTATLAQHSSREGAHETNDDTNAMLGFKTPSGNIHCQVQDRDSSAYLRCDILEVQGRVPAKPRDCEFDWGQAFSVDERRARRMCYSDTVMDERLQTLPYGSSGG